MSPKWDERFMRLAEHISTWSKDPSTQVGAVIVDPETKLVLGMGYNGFPRGCNDHEDMYANRELKYSRVVHADANAVLEAGKNARGATMYVWPMFTCNECAKLIIQSGIKKVVSPKKAVDRWAASMDTAMQMYNEAGVEVEWLD